MAAVLLCVSALVTGCARRQTAVLPPPTPPPADTTTTPTPEPTPAPSGETEMTTIGNQDLRPAFFDLDSYMLRDDARAALDANARLLRENPNARIVIEGHCDERGTVEYNQALGERRAQTARDYMVAAGIGAERMDVISYGKERPFDPGHDESAWAQNRRAHFVVRNPS